MGTYSHRAWLPEKSELEAFGYPLLSGDRLFLSGMGPGGRAGSNEAARRPWHRAPVAVWA